MAWRLPVGRRPPGAPHAASGSARIARRALHPCVLGCFDLHTCPHRVDDGLSQRTHRRVGYQDGVEFDIGTTLAGEFRRGGYQTQVIGKMHVYPERSRIGFDDVILHDGYLHHSRQRVREYAHIDDYLPWLRERDAGSDYADSGMDCNSIVARPWDKPEALHPTNWLASRAVNWLYRRDPTQLFLLYLSFVDPHSPLQPPAWAFEQYLDAPPYEPVVGDWVAHTADAGPARCAPRPVRDRRCAAYCTREGAALDDDAQFAVRVDPGQVPARGTKVSLVPKKGSMHLFDAKTALRLPD